MLAATQAHRFDVHGRAYFVRDFDENIVCVYRALAGRRPPIVCLPYWLLLVLVRVCMAAHLLVIFLTFGMFGVLQGKTGLHDGALAAALPCTVSSARAKRTLGYASYAGHVTREAAVASCVRPFVPLIDDTAVAAAVMQGCNRGKAGRDASPVRRKASPVQRKASPGRS